MTLVPIAAFLAGALLTILLPVLLLIALTAWYWWFSARVPDTHEEDVPPAPAAHEPATATPNPGLGPLVSPPAPDAEPPTQGA